MIFSSQPILLNPICKFPFVMKCNIVPLFWSVKIPLNYFLPCNFKLKIQCNSWDLYSTEADIFRYVGHGYLLEIVQSWIWGFLFHLGLDYY